MHKRMKALLVMLVVVAAFAAYTFWARQQPVDQQAIIDEAYEQAAEEDIKAIENHE